MRHGRGSGGVPAGACPPAQPGVDGAAWLLHCSPSPTSRSSEQMARSCPTRNGPPDDPLAAMASGWPSASSPIRSSSPSKTSTCEKTAQNVANTAPSGTGGSAAGLA
eukprot:scaffold1991_cov111-Isochrysis_galbana.AAC.5